MLDLASALAAGISTGPATARPRAQIVRNIISSSGSGVSVPPLNWSASLAGRFTAEENGNQIRQKSSTAISDMIASGV